MLVRKTIFGGIVTLDGNIIVDGLYGIYTGGNSQIGGTFQVIGTQRNFAAVQMDSTLSVADTVTITAALDIDIGASTEFDINDGLFRFSDGVNTLRVDDPNGIQLLGQTGVGSTPDAAYKLWVEPDDAQIGIGSQNDQTYGPLEDGWAAAPKAAMRITRDVSKYGLSDYAGIMFQAKPTSPHTAQGIVGVYSATPANHHSGMFMSVYSGQWTTILKGSMFGDWHFQTEEDRDIIFHLSQMDSAGYPADAISRFVMGYDYSTTSYIIEAGDAFTASPGIQVKSDNTVRLSSLTGTGSRVVYADASGNLSAGSGNGQAIYIDSNVDASATTIVTPGSPTDYIYCDLEYSGANDVSFYYEVHLDAVENAGLDQIVRVFAHIDCELADLCNLGVRVKDSANATIWSASTVDEDPGETWNVLLFWDNSITTWSVLSAVGP